MPSNISTSNSKELRELVQLLISSRNYNISVNAIAQSRDVFFDADARTASEMGTENAVDMGDFSAISNSHELQTSLLGHIFKERSITGSFTDAHNDVLKYETSIMGNLTGEKVSLKQDPFFDRSSSDYLKARCPLNGNLYIRSFDYDTRSYYLAVPNASPLNANIVNGAVLIK